MRLKANRNILQSYLRLYKASPEAIESEMMVLNAQEESLISVIRGLAPEQAGKVLNWARQLADLAGERAVQWSDSWTDEDSDEATAAAMSRFEDEEPRGS